MKQVLTPEDFKLLSAHLTSLDPIIAQFCKDHHFMEQSTGLGRYPRRRLNRYGPVNLYFDLQMDLAEDGSYFQEYFAEIPNSLGAGAWIDKPPFRYSIARSVFQRLAFQDIENRLHGCLESAYNELGTITPDYLVKQGNRSPLPKSD